MNIIQVNSFDSTGLSNGFNTINTIEIEDIPLGSGTFGAVYRCTSINGKPTQVPQVVKVFENANAKSAEKGYKTIKRLQHELKLKNIELINQHKTPVSDIAAFKAVPQFSYEGSFNGKKVFGYSANNLELLNFVQFEKVLDDQSISQQYRSLAFEIKLSFCYHLSYGFEILKSINYIHADINPQNFFVNLSTGELAIIDFDSGAIMDNPNDKPETFGKIAEGDWLAPEILEQIDNQTTTLPIIKINLHTDMWSVAVGIHHLIFLQTPFFFLKNLAKDTIQSYLQTNEWGHIHVNDKNYSQNLDYSNYQKYLNLLENIIPKEINRAFKATFKKGYFNPQNRVSYDQWTIAFKQSQNPPLIDNFSADKLIIAEGWETMLTWSVSNANRILLNGKIDLTNETEFAIRPSKTSTYFIQAFNLFGDTISGKIKIEVVPMPSININFPAPSITISFNSRLVSTQIPSFNLFFPVEAEKLTKLDERLLQSIDGIKVEHRLSRKIAKVLQKIFFIISAITILSVCGYFYLLTKNF